MISVMNLTVTESTFSGTNGTPPMFGIDLEPNRVEDRLEQIRIHNCTLNGNVGGGIQFGLHKLSEWGVPALHETTIDISYCTIDGSGPVTYKSGHHTVHRRRGIGPVSTYGFLLAAGGYAKNSAGLKRLGARGAISISNCSVKYTLLQGALVEDKPVEGNLSITFADVVFNKSCHYNSMLQNQLSKYAPPILVKRADGIDMGGQLRFRNCTVIDNHAKNRSFFATGASESHSNRGELTDVHGTFAVSSSYGCFVQLGSTSISNVSVVATQCNIEPSARTSMKADDSESRLVKSSAPPTIAPAVLSIKTDDTMSLLPQIKTPPGIKCNDPDVANAACFGFDPMDSTVAVRAALATNRSTIVIPKMSGPWIVGPMGGPAAMHLLHQKDMTIVLEPGVEIQAKRGDFHLKNQRLLLIEDCSNITILAYGSTMSMWRQDYANLTMYSKSEWRAGLAIYDSQHLKLLGLNISRTGGDGMTLTDVRNVYVKDAQLLNNYRQGPSLPKSLTLSK